MHTCVHTYGCFKSVNFSCKISSSSIQDGDLLSQVVQVHPRIHLVMMRKENQVDQSPGPRDQRKKRSANQEPSTPAVMMKKLAVLYHFQDSLEV